VIGDIERVLEALNSAGVRYLVVGGIAVVLHGHLRTTADLDLVVQLERGNALKAIRALTDLGYRPRAPVSAETFADEEVRESWLRDKGLTVFSLWSSRAPTLEVDLFVTEPFDFSEVYARALDVPLERTSARVVSLSDLIALKRQSGRPQDLEDISMLTALESHDPGENTP
jgi:hypothetical protein